MSSLELAAAQRLVDKALASGVPADHPAVAAVTAFICGGPVNLGAKLWAEAHPEQGTQAEPCCEGTALTSDPRDCQCWEPEYDVDQQRPRPLAGGASHDVAVEKCDDCAFRPESPERRDEWISEELYASVPKGRTFWCHQGMRRPAQWRHPDGRVIDGVDADWQPPILDGVPYRADGSPGLICAGWSALRAAHLARTALVERGA